MKKICIFISIIVCCLSMAAQRTIKVNDVYYNIYSDGTAEVTNYAGGQYVEYNTYKGNVIILPSVTDNGNVYRVTKIGKCAFTNSKEFKSINIPNRIKIIDENAFAECDLSSITIPEGVEQIKIGAFSCCHNLNKVSLPEGLKKIGVKAFADDYNLHMVNLPESVDSIGWGAFIMVATEEPIYNSHIFAYLPSGYSGIYHVPNGIKTIAPAAFFMGTDLTEIILPSSLREIGDFAFATNILFEAKSRNYKRVYGGCERLSKIFIPDGVTIIGERAFDSCEKLQEIHLPQNLTSIGMNAFKNCKSLVRVTIPDNVTETGKQMFQGCTNLRSVTLPQGLTTINNYTFYKCSNLMYVIIPNTVTKIGNGAFEGCINLVGLEIPSTVTEIGKYAFEDLPYIIYSGTATGAPWGAKAVCQ